MSLAENGGQGAQQSNVNNSLSGKEVHPVAGSSADVRPGVDLGAVDRILDGKTPVVKPSVTLPALDVSGSIFVRPVGFTIDRTPIQTNAVGGDVQSVKEPAQAEGIPTATTETGEVTDDAADDDWLRPWKSPPSPKYQPSEAPGPFHTYEAAIFEQRRCGPTFRGIRHETMLNIITPDEFEGKTVVDLGSGHGGLAKSISVEEINATVISVNPLLRDPENKRWEERATAEGLTDPRDGYPNITREQIVRAQRFHDAHLSTSFAHAIDIADNTADLVVDNMAVHAFMFEDEAFYKANLREMLRITKLGGEIRVGAYRHTLFARGGFFSTVLNQNGIPFYPIIRPRHESVYGIDEIIGARIYKRNTY